MVDRDRVLAKLDELEGYLRELRAIAPERFEDYQRTEKRRPCEHPSLRTLLVHEYGRVNDEIVFDTVRSRLGDFDAFKAEIVAFLRK